MIEIPVLVAQANKVWPGAVSDALSLTFDEAEAVAFALRDLALIVRAQHDVGIAEVA